MENFKNIAKKIKPMREGKEILFLYSQMITKCRGRRPSYTSWQLPKKNKRQIGRTPEFRMNGIVWAAKISFQSSL